MGPPSAILAGSHCSLNTESAPFLFLLKHIPSYKRQSSICEKSLDLQSSILRTQTIFQIAASTDLKETHKF